jgi:hypothetical protein
LLGTIQWRRYVKLALVLLQSMVVASGKGHHKMLQQYTKKKKKKKERERETPMHTC